MRLIKFILQNFAYKLLHIKLRYSRTYQHPIYIGLFYNSHFK